MAIEYSIDPDLQLIRVRIRSDELNLAEVRSHLEALRADPRFDNSFRRIIDARAVRQVPTSEVIRRILDWVTRENPERSARAFVADSTALYGMFRMLEIMSEGTGHRNRAFKSVTEAERWLGV